ncbi:ABC transporter substrate-binding protein [Vibrio ostreicida]
MVYLLELDWASQRVLTYVLSDILASYGIDSEVITIPSTPQWMYLSTGKADIQVEVWEGSMGPQFEDLRDKNLLEEGAVHFATTREEWWYPKYVESMCPGLPDWKALKACSALFAQQGEEVGTFYTGPWEKPDNARIRALDLDFKVVILASGEAINQKIHEYIAQKKPLLIFNWSPNWVEFVYPGSFVEFPDHTQKCEDDPSWGYSAKFLWDCGNPKDGWLKVAISKQLFTKSPCALKIVQHFRLTNSDIALAATLADIDKLEVDDAAREWIKRKTDYIQHLKKTVICQ